MDTAQSKVVAGNVEVSSNDVLEVLPNYSFHHRLLHFAHQACSKTTGTPY